MQVARVEAARSETSIAPARLIIKHHRSIDTWRKEQRGPGFLEPM